MPDEPNQDSNNAPADKAGGVVAGLVRVRTTRMTGLGAQGLAVSSMGLALGLSVLVGYLAGHWLDEKFHATYWTSIGLLVGAVAGFREVFLAIRSLIQAIEREQRDLAARRKENELSGAGYTRPKGKSERVVEPNVVKRTGNERPRSFHIPEPPIPGLAVGSKTEVEEEVDDDISTLTERLLNEENDRPLSS